MYFQMAMAGVSALQGISKAQIKKYQYKTEQASAKLNANFTQMQLTKQFNKTMASNAVIAAAQGRRGGTVTAVMSAAESGYNWDSDFAELSRDIQEKGIQSQMASASREQFAQISKAGMSMLGTYTVDQAKLGSIGGSTKGKK